MLITAAATSSTSATDDREDLLHVADPLTPLASSAALLLGRGRRGGASAAAASPAAEATAAPGPLTRARERMHQSGPQLVELRADLPADRVRPREGARRVVALTCRAACAGLRRPLPKSCPALRETCVSWNAGEPGRPLYDLDPRTGADLLLLSRSATCARYTATAQAAATPPRAACAEDRRRQRPCARRHPHRQDVQLRELTYRDAEATRTTFRFADRRAPPPTAASSRRPPRSSGSARRGNRG